MKILATSALLVTIALWSCYYAVSRAALLQVDAMALTLVDVLAIMPAGLILLTFTHRHLTRRRLWQGALLGGCFALVLITLAISLEYASATETACAPCLNGIFAAIIAHVCFKQSVARPTWWAALLALIGMGCMMGTLPHGDALRGDIAALLSALCYVIYLFLVERSQPTAHAALWAVLGVQFVSMALGMLLFIGLGWFFFGYWPTMDLGQIHRQSGAIIYAATTVILSIGASAFIQRALSASTISLLFILEPVGGSLVAHSMLGESFGMGMYVGQGLILAGLLLHITAGIDWTHHRQRWSMQIHQRRRTWKAATSREEASGIVLSLHGTATMASWQYRQHTTNARRRKRRRTPTATSHFF